MKNAILRIPQSSWAFFATLFIICHLSHSYAAEEQRPFGIDHRIPWTTSRVVGSPDPLPYAVEQTFTRIKWRAPIYLTPEPGTDSLLVVLHGGEKERPSRILRVRDDPDADHVETFMEMTNRLIYSVAFHPGYQTNNHIYLFIHGDRTNRISQFTVERQSGSPSLHRCDPLSERIIIEWHSEGHDGGGVVFGHDGMLYISAGDGTTDSDKWTTGQDLSDLLGGMLRIDVDHVSSTQNYSVPKDNPFVGWTNARPENWCYGLRNPWRLCVDQKTGQIWVGNNGQDLWESAHLARRGENYGWSVYEGSHAFYLNRTRGPTPVVPPTIEHPHSEMRSLTGGAVYYGDQLQELDGVYVYGDHSTGEIWGARHNGSRLVSHRQLAATQLQITAFAVDQRGDLLIADYGGGLYRLVRTPRQKQTPKFPTRLSETGLFVSTKDHQVQPGLIPYSVNAPAWVDGAHVQRFMALPDDSRLGHLTNGAVLMQTLSLDLEADNPDPSRASRRIETRLLTRQTGQWVGYSYRWNENQTDATLVGAQGGEKELVVKDGRLPGGQRKQVWRYPSRTECMTCHSRAANFVLGLTDPQLNKLHDYGAQPEHGVHSVETSGRAATFACDQLRTLKHIGVFTGTLPKPSDANLVDPYDSGQSLDARARSYLHVNCSVCHVQEGGGNAKMELGFTTKADRMNIFGARPQHDTFGIDNAMLVSPGDPERSVLYRRLSRRGRGQMPPLVSTVIDERAASLFRDWIREMKVQQKFVRDWKIEDLLPRLEQINRGRSFEAGSAAFRQTGCNQCHRFAGEGGNVGPDLSGVGHRLSPRDLLESLLLPSKVIAQGYATTEIELKSGDVINGRIEREDEQVLVIRSLSATEEAVTLRKKEIRHRTLSSTSNMPSAILNTLEETQILDLMAYLISDGMPTAAPFH